MLFNRFILTQNTIFVIQSKILVSMAGGETSRGKQGKHVGKKKWQCPTDSPDDIPGFNSMHFPIASMANYFYDQFIPRPVLPSYFVNMDCMDSLFICNKKLRELLDGVKWSNALNIAENAYPNLVKVFFSNMDISTEKQNRVITSVAGIPIEFDVADLNTIIRTKYEGLELYSLLISDTICNLKFLAQYLCSQVQILHNIL